MTTINMSKDEYRLKLKSTTPADVELCVANSLMFLSNRIIFLLDHTIVLRPHYSSVKKFASYVIMGLNEQFHIPRIVISTRRYKFKYRNIDDNL